MRTWTDDEDRLLMELAQQGLPWTEVAEQIPGRTESGCSHRYNRIKDKSKRSNRQIELVEVEGQPVSAETEGFVKTALEEWRCVGQEDKPSWQELLQYAQRGAKIQQAMRPFLRTAERTIKTDKSVFISFASDFHWGAPATDHFAFMEMSNLVMSREDIYLVIVGVDLETAFTNFYDASAVLNQTMPPWMQMEALHAWLEEAQSKILAISAGNHDVNRLERLIGDLGPMRVLQNIPYFNANGILTITVDNGVDEPQKYTIVMAHQYKGHSIYHSLQPSLRMFREISPLADIYVTAHTHRPAHMDNAFWDDEFVPDAPDHQHFIVTGTFKTGPEKYGQWGWGKTGMLGVPTIQLFADRHLAVFYQSPDVAIHVAKGGSNGTGS